MTTSPREIVLSALAGNLRSRRWGADPAIFFLAKTGSDVIPLPDLPAPAGLWDRPDSPALALAEFVDTVCSDAEAPPIPLYLHGLCFFCETQRPASGPRARNPVARVREALGMRHIWATDSTGDIYEMRQTRGSSVSHQVLAESDGWTGIGGTIPAALRQFAITFLDAPAHLL